MLLEHKLSYPVLKIFSQELKKLSVKIFFQFSRNFFSKIKIIVSLKARISKIKTKKERRKETVIAGLRGVLLCIPFNA